MVISKLKKLFSPRSKSKRESDTENIPSSVATRKRYKDKGEDKGDDDRKDISVHDGSHPSSLHSSGRIGEEEEQVEDIQDSDDGQYEGEEDDTESDDDGDEFIGGFELDDEKPKSFSCLSPKEIVAYQEREIKEIAELLSIPLSSSNALLRHFQWKREKLLTRYLEHPEKVCQESGVPYIPSNKLRNSAQSGPSSSKQAVVEMTSCSVCGEDEVAPDDCSSLSCGHTFCNECWESHLTTKVNSGEPEIRCLQFKCNIKADDQFIQKIVPPITFDKYARFVTTNFVQENDRVRWCPTPGCNNAISFDQSSESNIVECSCGYRFCFRCHREAHAPANCDHMKTWEQKCQDDSETFNWKSVNCRECPKCSTAVEKNGGCNHMTCRQCKFEWCWVCMKSWRGHNDFYSCNRFEKILKAELKAKKKSKRKKLEDEKDKKRQALERYLHYYSRFVNHDNSRKLEHDLRENALSKMQELQHAESTKAEVQFIEKAVDELQECRNVLKYTYVFSFFFFEEGCKYAAGAKDLFEMLQEDLEKTTERLSEVIENTLKRSEIEMSAKLEAI
eukprot:TRINITY_DN1948_c0_g1_i1.p1 TRINITY_DN1948_c0_g1~~TRINITY_DN1948_c0_g1_i1.p1  ORF type:complete len:560 (+),score=110.51 TRINITY_DN1948_c0_g1_i1:175-1854(+)